MIQYSKDVSKYRWGFEVNQGSSSNQTPLRWFKLLLSQHVDTHVSGVQRLEAQTKRNAQLRELHATLEALPKEKTPVDVVTDYLTKIYHHTLDALKKDYPESFSSMIGKEVPLRFVLTVPAVGARPIGDALAIGILGFVDSQSSRFGAILQRKKLFKQLERQE